MPDETLPDGMPSDGKPSDEAQQRRVRSGRLKMLAILLICAAPVIASYFTYYVIRPDGRTNYGTLLQPLPEVGTLAGVGLDGAPASLAQLGGHWLLLTGAGAQCDAACEHRLYLLRQIRLTTGKERDRVERVWVVEPGTPVNAQLLAEHEGLVVIRAPAGALAAIGFPTEAGDLPGNHIWIVDPLGNLVLRYPLDPDPSKMKKDLLKLLKASRIG